MPDPQAPTADVAVPVRRVAAIVVSWRQVDQLAACLEALEAQRHPQFEVVVVENASGDGSLEVLRAAASRDRRHPLTIVANPSNRGFSGGVHDGLAAARPADAVWLVNVDAIPAPDHLERLVAVLASDPACAAVQGQLVRSQVGPDGTEVLDSTGVEATRARLFRDRDEGRPVASSAREAGEVFGVTGACALYRSTALEQVRWRDGSILTGELFAYFEDVDLAWRLQRFGWTCRYEPRALATHERGGAGPRRSAFVEELNAANRLLVLATHDRWRTLGRSSPLVVVTTVLKWAELALSVPSAWLPALRRTIRGWRAARARRDELDQRAPVAATDVVARWFGPFRWRPWVATWWRRIRGRAPGVAGGGRPR
ncbi:MAG: glycosyltransferase family 2 protein [Nitriliruptor sp.]|uniref:glycosyltransferase family 2 protein n=1 Tax=Nitriliruptor sp. TaxID=2448056 RepID=UPI0034A083C8